MRNRCWSAKLPWLAVACLIGSAPAVGKDAGGGTEPLDTFLQDVDSFSASFQQSLVDADDSIVETSSGSVHIKRPGQFRWTYEEPYRQELVADGANIWSYDVDLDQVIVKPQQEMLANTPATLLGGSRDVLDEFEVIDSSTDSRGTYWATLRPLDTDNGFTRVELGFDDGVLRRMIFADSLGQTTLIALSDVVVNEPVDDDLFRFAVPEGVDLVGEPLEAE